MNEMIKKVCGECGHSKTDHLKNINGIYCQRCEREGRVCEWEGQE